MIKKLVISIVIIFIFLSGISVTHAQSTSPTTTTVVSNTQLQLLLSLLLQELALLEQQYAQLIAAQSTSVTISTLSGNTTISSNVSTTASTPAFISSPTLTQIQSVVPTVVQTSSEVIGSTAAPSVATFPFCNQSYNAIFASEKAVGGVSGSNHLWYISNTNAATIQMNGSGLNVPMTLYIVGQKNDDGTAILPVTTTSTIPQFDESSIVVSATGITIQSCNSATFNLTFPTNFILGTYNVYVAGNSFGSAEYNFGNIHYYGVFTIK